MNDRDRSARLLGEIFLASFMSALPSAETAWAASTLARGMTEVRLRAGEVLYRQGGLPSDLFFIVEGEVRLEAPGLPQWTMAERSLIGALDVQLDRPRSRTVTATRDTRLLRVPAGDWLDLLEDSAEMARTGIENLARGLHRARLELDALGLPESVPQPTRERAAAFGLVDRIVVLRGVPLLATADWQSLTSLAQLAGRADLEPGETIGAGGMPSDALFVVVVGSVLASRPGIDRRVAYGPGALVLGSATAAPDDLGYLVRADRPTVALRIAREDLFDVMEDHFSLARSAMRALGAERERLMNERSLRPERSLPLPAPPP